MPAASPSILSVVAAIVEYDVELAHDLLAAIDVYYSQQGCFEEPVGRLQRLGALVDDFRFVLDLE